MRHRLRPGSYDVVPIAETGGRFVDFAPYVPAINDRGVVAFQAIASRGESGVYRVDGGSISPIFESSSRLATEVCSHPDIDLAGAVCFYAERMPGRRTVVLSQDGRTAILADDAGPLGPTMNDIGAVAFRADLESGASGIFTGREGLVTPIAVTGDVFSAFHGLPVINSQGVVVFRADLRLGGQGIFTGDGGPPVVVAATGSAFRSLGDFPFMDDDGAVAFCADFAGGGSGAFVALAGHIKMVIDTTGAFESFRGGLLSEGGRLIFYGTPRGEDLGIFTGRDPRRDCVLAIGGPLFDSTVVEFALNPVSINRIGQIAIRVRLANGREFVVQADPRTPSRSDGRGRGLAGVAASGSGDLAHAGSRPATTSHPSARPR